MRTVMASPIAYSMGTDAVEIAAGAATIELTVTSAVGNLHGVEIKDLSEPIAEVEGKNGQH